MIRILALAVVAIALALPASAEDSTKPIEPFNGKDLTGWKPKDEKKHQWRLMRVVVNDKEPTVFSKSTSETDPYELVCVKPGGTDLLTEQ